MAVMEKLQLEGQIKPVRQQIMAHTETLHAKKLQNQMYTHFQWLISTDTV
jgi:hypothetical protein